MRVQTSCEVSILSCHRTHTKNQLTPCCSLLCTMRALLIRHPGVLHRGSSSRLDQHGLISSLLPPSTVRTCPLYLGPSKPLFIVPCPLTEQRTHEKSTMTDIERDALFHGPTPQRNGGQRDLDIRARRRIQRAPIDACRAAASGCTSGRSGEFPTPGPTCAVSGLVRIVFVLGPRGRSSTRV